MSENYKSQCMFCGAQVGEISEITEELVNKIYYCPKCMENYCDQCSYEEKTDGKLEQLCLRCDSILDKIDEL
jgi:hypothetical protein